MGASSHLGSIRLGKIFGIPLSINYSWLLIFGLVIFLLSARFSDFYPYWPAAQIWGTAIITAVLFFLSVLAHELSHSLVAVSRGIPVRGITLFIFGGVSQLAHEAQRPMTEFVVAVVGPLTSLVLGICCLGLWFLTEGVSSSLSAILFTLAAVNLSLGIFNMLPGFPLDGGRVLRAGVWGLSGNYWRATQVATRAGQGQGLLMVAGGIAWAVSGDLQGIWISLIGGFLLHVATSSYRQERLREAFKSYQVSDVMNPHWETLPGELPASAPAVVAALRRNDGFLGVMVDGEVQGAVMMRHLARFPRRTGQNSPVVSLVASPGTLADIMTPISSVPAVSEDETFLDAMEWMEAEGFDNAAVVRNGVLVGVVSLPGVVTRLKERRKVRLRSGR